MTRLRVAGEAAPPHALRSLWRGRVTVLAGLVVLGLNLRAAVTSVAPVLGLIRQDVPFGSALESAIATAPPLMFAVFGALAPAFGRRLGLERVVGVAMLVAAIGAAGRALTHDPLLFTVLTALAMAGLGCANVTLPPLVKRYFPDRIGLMTTASTVFLVIGQAMPPALALPIAERWGWPAGIGIWSVGAVLAAVPWFAQPFRKAREGRRHGKLVRDEGRSGPSAGPVWRATTFWGLTGLITSNSVAAYALMGWLPQMWADAGASTREGALWLTVFTLGSLLPALVAPTLTMRVRRTWILVVIQHACWTAGLIGMMLAPVAGAIWWMVLTRIGDANYACAITLMNLRTRRPTTLLAVSGFGQAIGYLAAAAVTFLFGQLHAWTDGWTLPLALLIAVMPIGLVGGLAASRRRFVEDQL